MIIQAPTTENLERELKRNSRFRNKKVVQRNLIDQTQYSIIEEIVFNNINPKAYILKTVLPMLKQEILVHQKVSNEAINAAKYYDGRISTGFNWILMEKLKDFVPIYLDLKFNNIISIAQKLGDFHNHCFRKCNNLRKKGISSHGITWYKQELANFDSHLKKYLSFKQSSEYKVTMSDVNQFNSVTTRIENMINPLEGIPLSLIHGDFDTGNIIIYNEKVCVIDWGMSRIDLPIIDIAQLINSLQGSFNVGERREVYEVYYERIRKNFIYKSDLEPYYIITVGKLLHLFFFLRFEVLATINNIIPPEFYSQTIYKRLIELIDLVGIA